MIVNDSFSKMMLENAGAAEALLRLAARHGITASLLEFQVKPPSGLDSRDPMQELL